MRTLTLRKCGPSVTADALFDQRSQNAYLIAFQPEDEDRAGEGVANARRAGLEDGGNGLQLQSNGVLQFQNHPFTRRKLMKSGTEWLAVAIVIMHASFASALFQELEAGSGDHAVNPEVKRALEMVATQLAIGVDKRGLEQVARLAF